MTELSIVDDCVFPIEGPANDTLRRVKVAMTIIYNTYLLFGSQLNMKRTKTAAAPMIRGTGSNAMSRTLHDAYLNSIRFKSKWGDNHFMWSQHTSTWEPTPSPTGH